MLWPYSAGFTWQNEGRQGRGTRCSVNRGSGLAAIRWVGRPCSPGCFDRCQPMRGMWRSPEAPDRPDRPGLVPKLSGAGRAADAVPDEGPSPSSSSPPDLPCRRLRRGPYGLVRTEGSPLDRVDPDIRASRNQTVLRTLSKDL